jgi:diaminopimelate epimerase
MKNQSNIKFTKMHGLGNDFMVIDAITQTINVKQLPIQQWSNRFTGIGFDQLLLIESSKKADFSCRFFNADGSEAEQCGNGVRCVARYVHENGLWNKNILRLETQAGVVNIVIHDYKKIEATLGIPNIESDIKLTLDEVYHLSNISMGNPHVILRVDSVKDIPVEELGHTIATHHTFSHGTNVGFMQIINPQHILLRTYERGVGKTFACGSNACAAVVAGILHHQLKNNVTVELELGELQIQWAGEKSAVVMTGPAENVFIGEIEKKS